VSDLRATMLAETLARVVSNHPVPDPWAPGSRTDDSQSEPAKAVERLLTEVGWSTIGGEEVEAGLVAVAAVELGRGLVSVSHIDALLGGSPVVAGLVRHGEVGGTAFKLLPGDRLTELRILALLPVAYSDASAVASLVESRTVSELPAAVAAHRIEAWRGASIGYLAGLASVAFEDCLEHVRTREAFGSTLDALPSVQARLADAATVLEGARLLVEHEHSWAALSYVAAAAVNITGACHQLTGALGYTLDYPLQRRSRRARVMRSWVEWAADVATSSTGDVGTNQEAGT
jgi:hypothetical protein